MKSRFAVKKEVPASSWQHEAGPPPFLTKTFDMVDDISTAHVVWWSRGGRSFVVWDPNAFSSTLLPAYFNHNNFSTFLRQLNTYVLDANKSELKFVIGGITPYCSYNAYGLSD